MAIETGFSLYPHYIQGSEGGGGRLFLRGALIWERALILGNIESRSITYHFLYSPNLETE